MKRLLALLLFAFTLSAEAQVVRWGPANWALSSASSGGGTTLPADSAGLLANDGAGNLSWSPCFGYAGGMWTLDSEECELNVTHEAGQATYGGRDVVFTDADASAIVGRGEAGTKTFMARVRDIVSSSDAEVMLLMTAGDSPTVVFSALDTAEPAVAALPVMVGAGVTVSVKTQADSPVTIALSDAGTHYANTGATAQVVFNLPAALAGATYVVCSVDSDGAQVVAGAGDTITYGADTSGAAGNITATSGCATFVAVDGTRWLVTAATSTWTVSAP